MYGVGGEDVLGQFFLELISLGSGGEDIFGLVDIGSSLNPV